MGNRREARGNSLKPIAHSLKEGGGEMKMTCEKCGFTDVFYAFRYLGKAG